MHDEQTMDRKDDAYAVENEGAGWRGSLQARSWRWLWAGGFSVEPVLVVAAVGGGFCLLYQAALPQLTSTGRADDSYIKDIRPEKSVRETGKGEAKKERSEQPNIREDRQGPISTPKLSRKNGSNNPAN
ncbi:hypothetical protein H112_00115 [Trichophyton rubrum D6]|nr:hypothetical protein H100_00114 [Trichophyton rubrum MR850]EZF47047.1 hypothetical protein H102_00113 [Trichophyton rubrum CBS 100081]EZF57702.1 hypothetical protein H103_00115 [Trichophyton rubrum CBS 288.86]EZF68306.1 hypothetical protein H104_00113 [Trichophyton rubrum CBS 289.86]EZF89622.1 hypothetical protein H110_00115 [Trichophyton rubrum MR1448]EZG00437.1 hypothetical protein H113_00116 [Trichophyton rubrum MR1459]EZG22034.1 hypothetical protein H107_00117 [Trichophyton rubrum CBS 